ncbi:MAG: urea ABC transporter permease subunit UrtC [Actinomycetota bacterium]|nr:urea ABC transporter permease subunit UrtC [Actinomycetota bacterium]
MRTVHGGLTFALAAVLLLVVAPMLLSDFRLSLLAKFLTFAILAVGLDVAWGYGGMLSLGQGLFFGLGGYAMAMYLKLEAAAGGLPDFMSWSGTEQLPFWWKPFGHAWFALPATVLLPAAVAAVLGYFVFRNRVRGAYFAILTQALVAIFVIALVGQQGYTGGTNGLTNITTMFGLDLTSSAVQRGLYLVTVLTLGLTFLTARQLACSRFGRLLLAVRDGEDRVRFLGYDPTALKVVAFAFSAALAGLAGALFVPIVGIIAPGMLGIVASIEMVMWVAVGGRATLVGPLLGALLFSYGHTVLSERLPSSWLYLQGALLIVVVTVAPRGLAGLPDLLRRAPRLLRRAA